MLSFAVGSPREIEGKSCILTWAGARGHAVYGPYQHLEAGRYAVEFNLGAAEAQHTDGSAVCATVDVTADFGRTVLAREDVTLSRLGGGPASIRLAFHTEAPDMFEFRVAVTGIIPLLIEDYCRVVALEGADADAGALLEATRFPDPQALPMPPFFLQNTAVLRRLYEQGAMVKVVGGDVVLTMDGVSFYARVADDLRFVDEIFSRSTYNFKLGHECCVIDIGMNIGLVSLTFALKDEVKEVHSFEPFKGTYDRARANLGLNAAIAHKVSANNFGLAGSNQNKTVFIQDESDSGAFSIRGSGSGTPEQITVRRASDVLRPVIASAKSRGLDIVAKVDCEGSEFPIFQDLNDNGLLADISAFMVEWHRGVDGKTQQDLIAPLVQQGFVIFDLTGKTGNGFFYAVKGGRNANGLNCLGGAMPAGAAPSETRGAAEPGRGEARMPLISWAQAREDIYLLRALRDIRHDVDNGFYIDIGANDPETDSVTKMFYDCGWHGVNVEPSPSWHRRLVEQRPRDVNIQAAVSDKAGELTFYNDRAGGLGTLVETIAASHKTHHQVALESMNVTATTLTDICEKYAPPNIHFLKIDVEGAEGAVLRGMDFKRFRPWILCIESHVPLRTDLQTHAEWDGLVLNAGYRFVFTDMINRYYVAEERAERAASFQVPVDEFTDAKDFKRMRDLEGRVRALEQDLREIRDVAQRRA